MKHAESLEESLNKYFNYTSFQKGQKEIIKDVLKGEDVLGILPTGSGKSLCYQLPARLLDGSTLVVSPLISLMIDQVKQLKATQFKEVLALNSFIPYSKRKRLYKQLHMYQLIYVSPELLQQNEVIDALKKIKVNLFVIDEAHCISQWGFEFRPDYLKLESIIVELNKPPILALSATATEQIQQDIKLVLKRPNMKNHIYPMDKENIAFIIEKVANNEEKINILIRLLQQYTTPTLIYFSSRSEAEQVAKLLCTRLTSLRITFYHGGMENTDRLMVQQQFMNDQLDIVCCTSAFGMGINKSNIRFVIHYHLPPQLESFIQETGRAGRDGKNSASILFYAENDVYIHKNLINKELPSNGEIKYVWGKLYEFYLKDQALSMNPESDFKLNDIQWRFLHYQLEMRGMIVNNKIVYDRNKWEVAQKRVIELKDNRLVLKQQKLKDMVAWIHKQDCLRKNLYNSFQDGYKQPTVSCCMNCGFSLAEWKPTERMTCQEKSSTWQDELQKIFLLE
ncbi:RecQ family ATP-dependent DNA helicase [Virgibacillus sp. W0430]|uniref:RecQ family ATP-dependent DNA helicase n=1 Tax=Virgibacillus sp. W0430 TaxID=3391580 RepID=UPI003F469140